MSFLKKIFITTITLIIVLLGAMMFWVSRPITVKGSEPIDFSICAGSGLRSGISQMEKSGVPVQPQLFSVLIRLTGNSSKLKAGHYALSGGTTPMQLMRQLIKGDVVQSKLTIIEGWTFSQMDAAIKNHRDIQQHGQLPKRMLLQKVGAKYMHPEGLFFPDTYSFPKGARAIDLYRQSHARLMAKLQKYWDARDKSLPYRSPYDALIMASIVEKETGRGSDRTMIASVFVNRLKINMRLQTDPTVIYGMGDAYKGNIRKKDLLTDTPYNTYTRAGLPPTPIALPGEDSLWAAFHPAESKALYFVARGDGTSQFSTNLADHNRAVDQYQRRRRKK